jgi:hypothetical protein
MSEDIIERLDTLIATVRLAWHDELDLQRDRVLEDPVDAALLDAAAGSWVRSGDLQRRVAKARRVSDRAIRTHLASLVTEGLMKQRGDSRAREYRATGVV